MSMKARQDSDYSQNKLGAMGGKFKNEMNEAFDTRGKEAEHNQ